MTSWLLRPHADLQRLGSSCCVWLPCAWKLNVPKIPESHIAASPAGQYLYHKLPWIRPYVGTPEGIMLSFLSIPPTHHFSAWTSPCSNLTVYLDDHDKCVMQGSGSFPAIRFRLAVKFPKLRFILDINYGVRLQIRLLKIIYFLIISPWLILRCIMKTFIIYFQPHTLIKLVHKSLRCSVHFFMYSSGKTC